MGTMRPSRSQIAAGCIAVAHGVFAFLIPTLLNGLPSEYFAMLLAGIGIGQVTLLSAWAVIGPGRLIERMPFTLFLVVGYWYLLMMGNLRTSWGLTFLDAQLLGVLIVGEFFVLQVAFWFVRAALGWRIERIDAQRQAVDARKQTQFGMGHLMAWTTAAAIVFAVGGRLLPLTEGDGVNPEFQEISFYVFFFVASAFNAVFALPAVWGALGAKQGRLAGLLILAIWGLFLSALEGPLLAVITGAGSDNLFASLACLNAGLLGCVAGTLAVLRPFGYRLVSRATERRKDAQESKSGMLPENLNALYELESADATDEVILPTKAED